MYNHRDGERNCNIRQGGFGPEKGQGRVGEVAAGDEKEPIEDVIVGGGFKKASINQPTPSAPIMPALTMPRQPEQKQALKNTAVEKQAGLEQISLWKPRLVAEKTVATKP